MSDDYFEEEQANLRAIEDREKHSAERSARDAFELNEQKGWAEHRRSEGEGWARHKQNDINGWTARREGNANAATPALSGSGRAGPGSSIFWLDILGLCGAHDVDGTPRMPARERNAIRLFLLVAAVVLVYLLGPAIWSATHQPSAAIRRSGVAPSPAPAGSPTAPLPAAATSAPGSSPAAGYVPPPEAAAAASTSAAAARRVGNAPHPRPRWVEPPVPVLDPSTIRFGPALSPSPPQGYSPQQGQYYGAPRGQYGPARGYEAEGWAPEAEEDPGHVYAPDGPVWYGGR